MESRSGKKNLLFVPALLLALSALLLSVGTGSVWIPPGDIVAILGAKLFSAPLPAHIAPTIQSVLIDIRIPRALCAFAVGGMLSVTGAVMQSVLQNPLASSFTLGVSSGASLGASIVVALRLTSPVLGAFLLPFAGFGFAFLTMLFVLTLAARLDRNVSGVTVILLGMVVSLFMSAMVTLVSTLNPEHLSRILMWQMGSFAGRRWYHAGVLFAVSFVGLILLMLRHRELDLLSFGDTSARAVGVDVRRNKLFLLAVSSLITGCAVCFTGTIGFVDLIVPHAVRRLAGPKMNRLLLLSFLCGGAFLSLTDTVSRTVLSPREIPVGAVCALMGTPFFMYLYFGRKRR